MVTYTSVWDSEARLSSMVARILRMYSDDSQIILARRAYYGESTRLIYSVCYVPLRAPSPILYDNVEGAGFVHGESAG